ncbi:phosphoglycerate kinase [Pseudomonadota bacterium]
MFRKLKDCVVTNKNVFVRADMNVPIQDGKILDDTRIKATIPTLKYLLKNEAKIILATHLGRPKGQRIPEFSTRILLPKLEKFLPGVKIYFAKDCIGDEARKVVRNAKYGEVVLLENLRFHKGEEKSNEDFAHELASLANLYVNDAFAINHRSNTSIVGLPTILKSCAGFTLEQEIENLSRLISNPKKPMMIVIGGSKVSTKLGLIDALVEKADYILIGGGMANTFLYAMGYDIGKSMSEKELKDEVLTIIEKAKTNNCKLILPEDVVVCKELKEGVKVRTIMIDKVEKDDIIADIGEKSIVGALKLMQDCKTVVWNGPLGVYEIIPFNKGTDSLAQGIATLTENDKILSIAGGGDVIAALNKSNLGQKFTYLSTAGGAFLKWLEGKELPGIKAIS